MGGQVAGEGRCDSGELCWRYPGQGLAGTGGGTMLVGGIPSWFWMIMP